MGDSSSLETDYLVVGAGAMGMAFVDALIDESDAHVVMVDRRHRPGGHWLDSYPFVQLHQPSKSYGVNSTPLGQDRIEPGGREKGFLERASGAEICGYFDEVMEHRLLTAIMTPAMAIVWLTGLMLAYWEGAFSDGWLHAKLALVFLLSGYQGALSRWTREFAADRNTRSAKFYRIANEVPTVFLIAIVLLVVLKPF